HTIIMRHHFFGFMGEPTCPPVLIEPYFSSYRHNDKLSVIVHPRRRLMGLFKPADFISGILIDPSISHFAGLGSPEIHAPWAGNGGVYIPVGQAMFGVGSHKWIDPVHRVFDLIYRRYLRIYP